MNVKKFLVCFVACLLCLSLPMMSYASEKNAEYTDVELIELASKGVYVNNSNVKVTPVNENEVTFKVTDDSVERYETNFIKILEKGQDGKVNNARVTGYVTIYSDDFTQTRGGIYEDGSYGRSAYATVEMRYESKTFDSLTCIKPTTVLGTITSVSSGISVPTLTLNYRSSGPAYTSTGDTTIASTYRTNTYTNDFRQKSLSTTESLYISISTPSSGANSWLIAPVKNSSTGEVYGTLRVDAGFTNI